MRRSPPFLLLCVCAALWAAPESLDARPADELARLREIQNRTVRTIEAGTKAFVFLQGGSGFLISADGYILTNNHVVRGRKKSVVRLVNGKNHEAKVVGHDPQGDIALLKIDNVSDLPFLELGDSSKLKVGQPVVALGDPFLVASLNLFFGRTPPSQEPSASLGIVSALHRYSDTYSDAIQVDTAVNQGNSGGPLLTLDGKVVGINGKIETRFAMGVNSGVGYAVPSQQIKNFLPELKKAGGGALKHGTIDGLRVADRADGKPGLPIWKVEPDSDAEAAGLEPGDLLVSVDGAPVLTRNRYKGVLGTLPAGRTVTLQLLRGAEGFEVTFALKVRQGASLGIRMENGPKGGVLVKETFPDGPAAKAGIRKGDIILLFQGLRVGAAVQLRQLLELRSPGDQVELAVLREKKLLGFVLRLASKRRPPARAAAGAS